MAEIDSSSHITKKVKIDPWGNSLNITESEVTKLQKDIIEEGMNKRSYSSAEDSDSETEIIKMYSKQKSKKEVSFDYIGYSFTINNRLSKTRSELARVEERMRYLQLDHSNKTIQLHENVTELHKNTIDFAEINKQNNKNKLIIKIQQRNLYFCSYFIIFSISLNIYLFAFNSGMII